MRKLRRRQLDRIKRMRKTGIVTWYEFYESIEKELEETLSKRDSDVINSSRREL